MSLFTRHNYCVSPYPLHGHAIDKVPLHQLDRCPAPQELQLPKSSEPSSADSQRPANLVCCPGVSAPLLLLLLLFLLLLADC